VGSQSAHYRALGDRIAQIAQVAVFVDSYREYKAGVHKAGMPPQALFDGGRGLGRPLEFLHRELRSGDVALIKGRFSQKLERIALALEGRPVRCMIESCDVRSTQCHACPMLEKGWKATLM